MTVINAGDRFSQKLQQAKTAQAAALAPKDDTDYEYRLINLFVAAVSCAQQGDKASARRLVEKAIQHNFASWIALDGEMGRLVDEADVGSVVFPND